MHAIRYATLAMLATGLSPVVANDISPEQLTFFESKIRPVLIKECYGCHSNKSGNVRGGLRLDTRELTHIGGSSGPAVVPGEPDESFLYTAITHQDFVMPPKRKLAQSVIDDFREWIEMGAPDPRVTKVAEIRSSITSEDIEHARENFWAYQPPQLHNPPSIKEESWAKTPIDNFVLAKLEASEIRAPDDAEPYNVLRRLCFDLVGLPPTPEQIEYFNRLWRKNADEAINLVVDSLLKSPLYGERWGRHWLDVARYAESTGREVNMTYPHAWRYRDYVIDSFNNDKPYDQFVQEQLAGDLLPVETDEQWAANLIATTFLAMGPKNVNEQNRVQFAADLLDEQIDATTRVFLGMSVSCARCHDHKFDAIPQTDYYAVAGLFRNITTYFGNPPSEYGTFSTPQRKRNSSLILLPVDDPNPFDKNYSQSELDSLKSEIESTLAEAQQARRGRANGLSGEDAAQRQRMRIATANKLSDLSSKLAIVDANGNPRSYCMGVQERSAPQNTRLLVRGEIDQPGQTVERGFPQVLCSTPADIDTGKSGRLDFARWIGSDENTLSARVMVNRIWHYMLGQGLVTSTENFGVTGQPPSHPELLDYLAVRFVDSGWSVKTIVREIARSRVYRIDSRFDPRSHELDPENSLLWRANPRRLDAEAIRDAMLSVSGEIDYERPRGSEVAKAGFSRVRNGFLGDPRDMVERAREEAQRQMQAAGRGGLAGRGRSARMPQGRRGGRGAFGREQFTGMADRQSIMADIARKVSNQLDMEDAKFRSVYLPIVRNETPRSLEVFDFADSSTITGVRESSNTANQALYMLNNRFVIQQSDSFAKRVSLTSASLNEQINQAFVLAYSRPPTSAERSATADFVRSFPDNRSRGSSQQILSAICQSLFASAEFRYID